MTFPSVHKYLSLSGALAGGEAWSFGLRLTGIGFDQGEASQQTDADALAAIVETWWGTQTIIGFPTTLKTVKVNKISTAGLYVHPYTILKDFVPPKASSTQGTYPNQVACVVTLETGVTRGLAHRGRVFLPAPTANIQADGRITEAAATAIATSFAGLLSSLNAAAQAGFVSVGSDIGAGAFRPVTGVTVGRVLDTMRSRRSQMLEGRMSAAVTAGT